MKRKSFELNVGLKQGEESLLWWKENFSDDDGELVGKLQTKYEEIGGWNAESDAANLLSNIDIK